MMISLKRSLATTSAVVTGWAFAASAFAANNIFGSGPDLGTNNDIRGTVTKILTTVLSYMALAAVIVIVIAGIRLVISSGDESAVDKAKKTILYAVIGLIIILLANAIVNIVASIF